MLFLQKKLVTDRLILRRWFRSDSINLYHLAKIPEIGIQSGWKPHTSVFYSENILKNTYMNKYHFAVILKDNNELIGNISLIPHNNKMAFLEMNKDEAELGYWIGKPYWGNGFATEAAQKVIEYGFSKLKYTKIWCGSLRDNIQSKRVQEKCGFEYRYSINRKFQPDIHTVKKEDIYSLDRFTWKLNNEKKEQ